MDDVTTRFVSDLIGRLTGPMAFRLVLQPAMATFFAIRDGARAARLGRPPYFWSLFSAPAADRRHLLEEAWKAVVKVFALAFLLDVVYQLIVFRWVYPFESLAVAIILAFLPYVLLRGVVNRIVSARIHSREQTSR
jgi:hypothetical protein